ncbi:hypothetical protein [Streptomyces sp. NPDC057253]
MTGFEHGIWSLETAVVVGRPVAVTCGHDKTVRVWDLTGLRAPVRGHTS